MISPTKRFRRAVGSLDDSDSNGDPEIEASAVSTPCGMSITHFALPSPSKRQKMNPADEQVAKSSPGVSNMEPEANENGDQTPREANPAQEKKRNQVQVSCYFEVAE